MLGYTRRTLFFGNAQLEGHLLSAQTNMRSPIATGNSHCAMVFAPEFRVYGG